MKKYSYIICSLFLAFSCQSAPQNKQLEENNESNLTVKDSLFDNGENDRNKSTTEKTLAPEDNLKIIYAVGGEGQNINWPVIKKETENDDSPEFFYNDCEQGVESGKASSSLAAQGKNSYTITKINDQNPMTAWVEGVEGYGIGEWFEIKAPGVNSIYNGYQSTPTNWKNNSRVKKFKVYKDSKPLCYLVLTDEMGQQRFELPFKVDFESGYDNPSTFKFEIVEVYKGDKWDDVAISEIGWVLCCFAEGTEIASFSSTLSIENLNEHQQVLAVDIDKNTTYQSEITGVIKQIHLTLLTVSTTTKSIQLTPEHPLYVKGIGFISLDRLRHQLKLNDFAEMIGTVEVLTWNPITKVQEYETISAIQLETGKFQTYTIRQLTKGMSYIANGFVTKTY